MNTEKYASKHQYNPIYGMNEKQLAAKSQTHSRTSQYVCDVEKSMYVGTIASPRARYMNYI